MCLSLFSEPNLWILLFIAEPKLEMEDIVVDTDTCIDLAEVGIGVDLLIFLDEDLGEVGIDGEDIAVADYDGGAASRHDDNSGYFALVDGMDLVAGENIHIYAVVAYLDLRQEGVIMLTERASDHPASYWPR